MASPRCKKFNGLNQFVQDNLLKACDVADASTCNEKEQKYITKMQAKSAEDDQTQSCV
jgi:hypothetical protein